MSRKNENEALAKQLSEQAHGHYLDRMERAAGILERHDLLMGLQATRILYTLFQCKPKGIDGILYEFSASLLYECVGRGFNKKQQNALYYVLYSSLDLGLSALPEHVTNEAGANT